MSRLGKDEEGRREEKTKDDDTASLQFSVQTNKQNTTIVIAYFPSSLSLLFVAPSTLIINQSKGQREHKVKFSRWKSAIACYRG